jgi:GDPmannose 4,6-dehydratase
MRALITGIGGQDGSYLAELLVARGVEVHGVAHGVVDASKLPNLAAVAHDITLHALELADAAAIASLLRAVAFDSVFHLAARSFLGADDEAEAAANIASTRALLDVIAAREQRPRFLLAGSATQFAGASTSPQSELTPTAPTSAYGRSKRDAAALVARFRDERGVFACTAILYNHESPRRAAHFISKKLAAGAARIARGLDDKIVVGDLEAHRDWGYAPEYVDAMARMLDAREPDDFVIASGASRSVRDMARAAFRAAGLANDDVERHLVVDPRLVRAPDPVLLVGDASKAKAKLGWQARASLEDVMRDMVEHELRAL